MKDNVIAGIVTFNPDITRLKKNIDFIAKQVKVVLVVDNGSSNTSTIEKIISNNTIVIKNGENIGIAAALNIIMAWAEKNKYEWVVTLDQDSICPNDYIEVASAFFSKKNIGQIVPVLYESQSQKKQYLGDKPNNKTFQDVHKSITSASVTNVSIWKKIGGFDNELFIDYVDYDYALRLRLNGYKILRLNNVLLDHQIGKSENHNIGPISISVSNHSAFRKYYICRNIIIFIRKYRLKSNPIAEILRLLKVIVFIVFFEKEKIEKLSAVFKGIKDGLVYNVKKD